MASSAVESMPGLARQRDLAGMKARFEEMISTCNACHASFRILPVARQQS
jgi:cytochrome c556